mmetsp:Transcript_5489/g.4678  ORF Transcript_5489/g.4678 Transcript_5489/m.4678 type:complete len:114 (+) Transcript_5489:1533-1874(+)
MVLTYCDNILLTDTLTAKEFLKIQEWMKKKTDEAIPEINKLIDPTLRSDNYQPEIEQIFDDSNSNVYQNLQPNAAAEKNSERDKFTVNVHKSTIEGYLKPLRQKLALGNISKI